MTGASGFTGGHLVRHLQEAGYGVTALVRSSSTKAPLERAGVELAEGDVRDRASLVRAIPDGATVFHVAAAWQDASLPDRAYHEVNVEGTRNVIEAAHERRATRVVHCSSIGVHGDTGTTPATESAPFAPPDAYCVSKAEGERVARSLFESLGLDGVVFRPLGIYGPGDRRFLKLFRSVSKGRFVMLGDGSTLYHMTYIDDLCRGILLCAEHPAAVGQAFILGGGTNTTLNELVAAVAQAVDRRPPSWRLPLAPVMLAARATEAVCKPLGVHPPLYPRRVEFFSKDRAVDIGKARSVLGYEPQVSLADGLRRTAAWYRASGWL